MNDDDVTIVGASYAPAAQQPQWALGDFEYNGRVDDDDVTLLGAFFEPVAGVAAAPAAAKDELRSTKYEVQSTKHGVPDNALVELLAEETAQLDDSLRDRGLAIGRLLRNMQFYWPL